MIDRPKIDILPSCKLALNLSNGYMNTTGTKKVFDHSQYNNHGIVIGALPRYPAFKFDGVDDYVDCGSGNNGSFDITDAITIEAWVKKSSDDNYRTIYTRGYGGIYDNYIWTTISNNNYPYFRIEKGGTQHNLLASQTVTVADGWTHLVFWWNGSIMKIAINGEFDTNTLSFTDTIAYDVTSTWIGQRSGLYFNGAIDEVRIWNEALTAIEVKNHYELSRYRYGK